MKKLLVTLVALVCAVVGYAQQSTMVATLTHGETITSYYGTFAFQKAVEAAVDGDVITLSGAAFSATDIRKAITVRGAGMDGDNPTIISGYLRAYTPESEHLLTFEGVKFDNTVYVYQCSSPINFNKCDIKYFSQNYNLNLISTITNCIVRGGNVDNEDKVTMINCLIDFESGRWEGGISIINCVFYSSASSHFLPGSFVNSIIINGTDSNFSTEEVYSFKNCVCIGNGDLFTNPDFCTNCYSGQTIDIFEGSDWKKPLTATAKATLKGDDDSEVGIYGGFLPWSSTPSYPQITKLNISNRTTSDGQLSVDVEVNSVQQQ
ncbi:MAG: hypothetical protein ACI3Y0_12155 [Prevotella sp.]